MSLRTVTVTAVSLVVVCGPATAAAALLDLQDAHPGENWAPLRRFVAREPSIRACAPRRTRTTG
jgi:hypothetical protein